MRHTDVVIIGGGPAGLAAAASLYEQGIESVLIIERDKELGGILNQCIHNGFGLHAFKEELTGPEYAARYVELIEKDKIEYMLNTMVIDVTDTKLITAINKTEGVFRIQAKAVILAMGCRERSRGALNIPGFRPAGVYSAGTAQRLVNMEGIMPGKKVFILGSGDIGLIMARRMTLEGAKVMGVAELMPFSGGLKRNIVQCLDDFNIPLFLSHTVIEIKGKERVEGVTVAEVDSNLKPIPDSEKYFECDTLLLSVGLIPENELSKAMKVKLHPITNGPIVNGKLETSLPGVFAAGNVLHVHDLVDYVSYEAHHAGAQAANYVKKGEGTVREKEIEINFEGGIRYTVPMTLDPETVKDDITVRFRVGSIMQNKCINVYINDERVISRRRLIMAPGEMEEIELTSTMLNGEKKAKSIIFKIEES